MEYINGIMSVCMDACLDLNIKGYDVIDPGVRDLVVVLHSNGYKTVCSCAGSVCNLEPYPWVVISFDFENEKEKVFNLLRIVADYNASLSTDGVLPRVTEYWTCTPIYVAGCYCLYLQASDNNVERSLDRVYELCENSTRLANFIEQNLENGEKK